MRTWGRARKGEVGKGDSIKVRLPAYRKGENMVVIVSWYSDGSGEPVVTFRKILYREGSGFYGHGPLIESLRDTKHQECRVWEVTDKDFSLLYDSTVSRKKEEQ